MKRLECLDGLRGVLAVYVMLSHMAPFAMLPAWLASPLSHGGAAVDVFFILSGLVIVRSLEKFHYRPLPFLRARVSRIFPAYLAIFALALAVQPIPADFAHMNWIGPDSPARDIWSHGWPSTWVAEITAHLTMTHGLFPHGVLPHVWVRFLGAAWSLSTEWQFYLLALMLGRWFGAAAWPFLALAVLGAIWAAMMPDAWQFSRAFLGNKAGYFALGMVSARMDRWRFLATLMAVLALAWWQGGAEKLLVPLLWCLCLAAQFYPWVPLLGALLRAAPLRWLGVLSYSLYLVNEPIQKLLGTGLAVLVDGDGWWFTLFWVPSAIILPLLAAMGLHRWVEAPMLQGGRRRC